jgi:aquaglyceroporin related protein
LLTISCFFTGFLGIVLLVFVVFKFAAADKNNDAVPKGLRPLTLFLALLGVGAAFDMQTCTLIHRQSYMILMID